MKLKLLTILTVGMLVVCAGMASAAPIIDVVQAPTLYFVPSDGVKNDAPWYRWWDEDWGWTHGAVGGTITTATLSISSFDVDFSSGEVDNIYAYDNGVKTLIGHLAGSNQDWSYTTFTLGSNFFDDIALGLKVWMDIDSTHSSDTWAVSLSKSVLSIDGGTLPPPNPTVPDAGSSLLLMGLGLAGLRAWKRRG